MNTVKLSINNRQIEVPSDFTILQAANKMGIDIPRLCFLKDINETAACRICVVEIEGIRSLKNSCTVKVSNGMKIKTNSTRIKKAVKNNLELLAANHKFECWCCPREHNCEFIRLLRKYNVPNIFGEDSNFSRKPILSNITESLIIDSSKCLLCGRCVATCEKLSGTSILDFNHRGFETYIGPALNFNMDEAGCLYCGKCIQACPVAAIKEKEDVDIVLEMLDNKLDYIVVQIAPSVRAALGEEFGYEIGTNVEGKMYHALHLLGFDDITDTNFAADVTILEEGTELINRLKSKENNEKVSLPLFTSCSPGWIRYIERYYPEYIPNLSTCKSPQQMQGAIIKHYLSKRINVPKEKIKVVSIMPCIAKKYEAKRPEMEVDGIRDVDYVLTTRELARMIKRQDIDFNGLSNYQPTSLLAKYTGAGVIFGATGGVMEAALRTVKDILENKDSQELEFTNIRGANDSIKEATINIAGKELNVAVVHGTKNAKEMMDRIIANPDKYSFIEFMACTGGCVNGGGQPIVNASKLEHVDVRNMRAKALYDIDNKLEVRKSHKNQEVLELYSKFLEKPGSEISHHLLHTHYNKKEIYPKK